MRRKLVLHKETLRRLEDRDLAAAAGGETGDTHCDAGRCSGSCVQGSRGVTAIRPETNLR